MYVRLSKGATLDALVEATGWLQHTTRRGGPFLFTTVSL
jgi:hypothetical protein